MHFLFIYLKIILEFRERGNLGLDNGGPVGSIGDHQEMLLRDNDEQISRLHEKTSAIREVNLFTGLQINLYNIY
jgi:hypothetical protein